MSFSSEAAKKMTDGPQRAQFAEQFEKVGLPSDEAEDWRYSPIGKLPLDSFVPQLEMPSVDIPDATCPGGASALVIQVNGWVMAIAISDEAKELGLSIEQEPWTSERAKVADSNGLDLLHSAFAPGRVVINVPRNTDLAKPIIVSSSHISENTAAFPDLVVNVAQNAQASVIERQNSLPGRGLTISSVQLNVADSARLAYTTIQNVGDEHWVLARHGSTTGSQAHLTSSIASFGGKYARVRTDADLAGRGASGELFAVYFGDAEQVHDFRTFQHHSERDTQSDLVFKGVLGNSSGSVYSGLVQIHPGGAGSNANQTNRNIKLSDDAWAWSVPNLEIENSDVRCSHASTVSPVDAEQRFYLHSRGVPPLEADKLIVAGFFEEVIQRLPAQVRGDVVELVALKLAGQQ